MFYEDPFMETFSNLSFDYQPKINYSSWLQTTYYHNELNSYLANYYSALWYPMIPQDSGIASDENSSKTFSNSEQFPHSHITQKERDSCEVCYKTIKYMLQTPFINYLDHKFLKNRATVAPDSNAIVYAAEYKLFENFQFSSTNRMTEKDIPNSVENKLYAERVFMERNREEFNYNGTNVYLSEAQEIIEFCPTANSTPADRETKQKVGQSKRKVSSSFVPKNLLCWKKPIVIDPKLSPKYDNAFPSLNDKSSKSDKSPSVSNSVLYFCAFCKNNRATPGVYMSHILRDSNGRICCPKLRAYECPICGAGGDKAHTAKYCPKRPLKHETF